jgi:hypothetical protein
VLSCSTDAPGYHPAIRSLIGWIAIVSPGAAPLTIRFWLLKAVFSASFAGVSRDQS